MFCGCGLLVSMTWFLLKKQCYDVLFVFHEFKIWFLMSLFSTWFKFNDFNLFSTGKNLLWISFNFPIYLFFCLKFNLNRFNYCEFIKNKNNVDYCMSIFLLINTIHRFVEWSCLFNSMKNIKQNPNNEQKIQKNSKKSKKKKKKVKQQN